MKASLTNFFNGKSGNKGKKAKRAKVEYFDFKSLRGRSW